MQISPARIAAYEVLLRIERHRAFSSVLLPYYEESLKPADAALCHQIVLGVLRKKLDLDSRIARYVPHRKLDLEVRIALRIGAYQLIELDRVPDHSAVNESVGLVQRARKSSAKGFVNAVLRKIAANKKPDGLRGLDTETSHPKWLLDRWTEQFGADRAAAIAVANNQPSRIAFRTRPGVEHPAGTSSSEIVTGAFTTSRITAELRELADAGEIYFQDEASQLIANLVTIADHGRFLDVCAAPGGKTSLIAARHHQATIVAGDLHFRRVKLVRETVSRQCIEGVETMQYDATLPLPFPEGSFDAVLVDAPCSGTGTISNNPEIRYFLSPDDIVDLAAKQLTILTNASRLLKPGGRLYYSTCSLERDENEEVVGKFLSDNPFLKASDDIDLRFRTEDGFGRTWPDRDGTDGFFFASMVAM